MYDARRRGVDGTGNGDYAAPHLFFSPTIQVDILKHDSAWFPLKNPALVTIPLSFVIGIVVSLATQDAEASAGFGRVRRRMTMGGAA
ncbi:MAG: hypothetical protein MNPFHGCM_02815 [Gemmatimonadaceae bacterium]|nr:hypothetical protein [Gemmatimonadaceae bacterium]